MAQIGDTGFNDIFLGAPLPYIVAATIIFVLFVAMVPILFNNMLVWSICCVYVLQIKRNFLYARRLDLLLDMHMWHLKQRNCKTVHAK